MPVRPHVTAAPQVPRYMRPLNQRQINAQADKQLAAAQAAARAPIVSAQAAADARAKAAQAALAGFGTAAMGLYTKPADVQKVYADAAQEQAGIAGAFTSAAGQQLTAAEKANAGFMDQQTPGASPQNEPNVPAAQDAAYYLGGYNPSSSIVAQGAAAASTAAGEPLLQGARTEQDMLASQAHAEQNDQQYVQDMLDLAAKAPDMRNQIMQTLYQHEYQKAQERNQAQAQALYAAQFGEKVKVDNAGIKARQQEIAQGNARIALSQAGLQLSISKQKFAVKQALIQGRRIDASASRAAGHLVDRSGNPILDKTGKPIPVQASSGGSGGTNNGVGSTGYHEAVRATHSLFGPKPAPAGQSVLYKYTARPGVGTYVQGSGWFTNDPSQAVQVPTKTFPEAVNFYMNAYGLTRKAARQALIAGGYKPNGKRPPKNKA